MGKRIKGITGKLILITSAMFMAFFVIVMVIQLLISGYSLIDNTKESINEKKQIVADYLQDSGEEDNENFNIVNEYDYDRKSFLLHLRKRISDNDAVCEFLIIDSK